MRVCVFCPQCPVQHSSLPPPQPCKPQHLNAAPSTADSVAVSPSPQPPGSPYLQGVASAHPAFASRALSAGAAQHPHGLGSGVSPLTGGVVLRTGHEVAPLGTLAAAAAGVPAAVGAASLVPGSWNTAATKGRQQSQQSQQPPSDLLQQILVRHAFAACFATVHALTPSPPTLCHTQHALGALEARVGRLTSAAELARAEAEKESSLTTESLRRADLAARRLAERVGALETRVRRWLGGCCVRYTGLHSYHCVSSVGQNGVPWHLFGQRWRHRGLIIGRTNHSPPQQAHRRRRRRRRRTLGGPPPPP